MEADDLKELQERAERGAKEASYRPIAFFMSVMAVLVAITTVFSHRSHTEAILYQNQATDQWNQYQAKKIRSNTTALVSDLLSVVTIADKDRAQQIIQTYAGHQAKWTDDLNTSMTEAENLEKKVRHTEARALRLDFADALLEISLVITSVTLLTNKRLYWYFGIFFGVTGVISAASAFFLG